MNPLLSMVSEDGTTANVSTMRVSTLLIVLVILGTWSYVSARQGVLQPISTEQTALVLGALGLKAWQRGKESGTSEPAK